MPRTILPAALLALTVLCCVSAGQPPADLPVAEGSRLPQALTSAELRFSATGDKLLVVRHYVGGTPLVTIHDARPGRTQGNLIYFTLTSPDLFRTENVSATIRRAGVSAALDTGGNVLVTTSFQTARLWDISRGHKGFWPKPVAMDLPGSVVSTFTQDGKHLLTATLVGGEKLREKTQFEVKLWDVGTGKPVGEPGTATMSDQISPALKGLAFAPDGSFFLVAIGNGQSDAESVQFWDAKTLKPLGDPLPAAGGAYHLAPDGKTLLAVSRREVARWDIATRKLLCALPTPDVPRDVPTVTYSYQSRPWVAVHPNGTSVLYRKEERVTLWDLGGEKPAEKVTFKHAGKVYWVALSRDGKRAASACWHPDEVLVWDTETGKAVMKIPHTGTVEAMEFSPDGRLLATASAGDVHLWNLEPKK